MHVLALGSKSQLYSKLGYVGLGGHEGSLVIRAFANTIALANR